MSDNKALLIADMPSEIFSKIKENMRGAMKGGDTARVSALRFVVSEIKNKEIDLRGSKADLTDEEVLQVLHKQVKQRVESIESFKAGGREDLVTKESNELAILSEYLPAQLSEVEIAALVKEAISEVGATSPADMGKVMGVVMPKVAGRSDGKLVAEAVRKALS